MAKKSKEKIKSSLNVRNNRAERCEKCSFDCNNKCTDIEDPTIENVCVRTRYRGILVVNDRDIEQMKIQINMQLGLYYSGYVDDESLPNINLKCKTTNGLTYAKSITVIDKSIFRLIYIPNDQIIDEERNADLLDISVERLFDLRDIGILKYKPSQRDEDYRRDRKQF